LCKKISVAFDGLEADLENGTWHAQAQRVAKLSSLLSALRVGKNVQNRQLKRWLNTYQYKEFLQEWETQRAIRKELKEKPEVLKGYERKLKEVIIMNNRSEAYAKKGNTALHLSPGLAARSCVRMPWRYCKRLCMLMQVFRFGLTER
jgi:hypothetical protein